MEESNRAAFEAHMRKLNVCTNLARQSEAVGGQYRTRTVQRAWQLWLAALASQNALKDGYATAFYEIASVLGIGARSDTPENVFRNEMLPRIVALASKTSAARK